MLYYSNRAVINCHKVSIHGLLDHFDADLENDFEKNEWKLEHNAEELQCKEL